MQQTLFLIPQSWLEGPLLIGWLVLGLLIFGGLLLRHGWSGEAFGFLPAYLVVAVVLAFVAPRIGITDIDPTDPNGPEVKVGLAVRGYGVMMLAGIVAGVGLSIFRGRQQGLESENMLTLAFWMCLCGVVGARLFYVIQKRDQFRGSLTEMLAEMVNMTQGGLVVYGALIGASVGAAVYMAIARIPMLRMADIAIPGMLTGLALGRIGCLLNGCCFGGVCDIPQIAQHFPAGSPPYLRQIETGELLGIHPATQWDADPLPERSQPDAELYAKSIESGSLAARAGLQPNHWYRVRFQSSKPPDKELRAVKQKGLEIDSQVAVEQDTGWVAFDLTELPDRSLGVYPTQILAALNAGLLAVLLWFAFPFRRRDGQIFALGIILYSITRFLLELIRRDEFGQFGTDLTISQWVSIFVVLAGLALIRWAPRRQPEVATPADV